jgi:transcriptional regulator with XRE-family HTH domain
MRHFKEVVLMVQSVRVVRTVEVEVPELGKRIREARKEDARSVTQIAAAAGMSVQNWYRIEDEKQSLPEETLRLIESVLGIDFGIKFPKQI